ncbi:MAG TPA: extracellular solute-binding protein [Clostridiales bacterium]|nr:extracellular solute-binding protein [Clostridiales bacterium]
MSKNLKMSIILFVILALIGTMSGCSTAGKDTKDEKASTTAATKDATQQTTTAAQTVSDKPYVWKPDPADLEWKDDTSPVTLTAFLNFPSTIPFEWGKNDVTKEITKRTGVTIEATYAPDNESQRLSVMLASGDKLPDFIIGPKPPDPLYYNMIKDDVIWSYTELMDKYAPNMRKVMMSGNEEICAEDDGKLYWLGMTMVGYDQTDDIRIAPPPKFAVRNDVWEALGKPQIKTTDDLLDVLRKVKANNFEGIKYPIFLDVYNNIPNGTMFGVPGSQNGWIYDYENNKVNYWTELPKGKESLRFINGLVREGLFPEEAFTVQNYNDEIDKGSIFLLGNQNIFYVYGANKRLSESNPAKYYRYIEPIAKENEEFNILFNFRAYSWRGLTITKDCKNPERAIKYIEYMISDEGQQLFLYGIDGVHHKMKKTEYGWSYPVFNDDLSKLISTDFLSLGSKYGVYAHLTHCWLIKDIYDYNFVYGLGFSEDNKLKREGEMAYLKYRTPNRVDAIPNSVPSPSTDTLKPIPTKITEFNKQQFGKLLSAKTDEDFEKEYKVLIDGYSKVGIESLKEYYVKECKQQLEIAKNTRLNINYPTK